MSLTPSISVVVCTRDRAEHLNKCLSSLLNQSCKPKEIVIVDDASAELDILSLLKDACYYIKNKISEQENKINIKYIRNKLRQGTVKSRNLGIAAASSDIIAFIDDDGYAHKDWLKKISKHYRKKRVVGVGGPVVERGRKVERKQKIKRLSYITSHGNIRHHYWIKNLKETRNMRVTKTRFLTGGNMSFRKDALLKVNGFDPKFRGTYFREETDLCMRISKLGNIRFEPNAVTYHVTARTGGTRDISRLKDFLYWYFRNTSLLFVRHFDSEKAIKKVYRHAKKCIVEMSKGKSRINRDYLIIESLFKVTIAIITGMVFGILIGIFSRPIKRLVYKNPEYVITATLIIAGTTIQLLDARMLNTPDLFNKILQDM